MISEAKKDEIRRQNLVSSSAAFSSAGQQWKKHVYNRYRGADADRFSRDMVGSNQMGSSADYHYNQEIRYYRMQELARDIDRNDMVAGQAMDRLCTNVLQGGFHLDPQYGNDAIEKYVKQRWLEYSTDASQVDLQQERTFCEMSEFILRQTLTDGDHLVVPLDSGAFQCVETHLLRTPYGDLSGEQRKLTIHGVRLNENRQRVSYYIAKDDIGMWETLRHVDFREIPAFDSEGEKNAFLVKNIKRTSQTRGVSVYAPIIHAVGLLDDIQFAKLVQQQGVSVWIAAIERSVTGEYPDEGEVTHSVDNPCEEGEIKPLEDLSAGMIYKGIPGEALKGFSPNVPNPTYLDHARQVMELIGTNLGLPYIVLMMDASETNFSGWRGAMDQAKLLWQSYQRNLANSWHRQAFRFKMRQWTRPGEHFDPFLSRALSRGIELFSHNWTYPSWPYVNPVEDVTANVMEVTKAQNSPRRVQARLGRDYQQVIVGELLDDNFALIDRAMTLAEQLQTSHPDQPVSWEKLVAVSVPDNVNLNTSQVIEGDESDSQEMVADFGSE